MFRWTLTWHTASFADVVIVLKILEVYIEITGNYSVLRIDTRIKYRYVAVRSCLVTLNHKIQGNPPVLHVGKS